jgi:hypothetical protein
LVHCPFTEILFTGRDCGWNIDIPAQKDLIGLLTIPNGGPSDWSDVCRFVYSKTITRGIRPLPSSVMRICDLISAADCLRARRQRPVLLLVSRQRGRLPGLLREDGYRGGDREHCGGDPEVLDVEEREAELLRLPEDERVQSDLGARDREILTEIARCSHRRFEMLVVERRKVEDETDGAVPHDAGRWGQGGGRERLGEAVGLQGDPYRVADAVAGLVELNIVNNNVNKVGLHHPDGVPLFIQILTGIGFSQILLEAFGSGALKFRRRNVVMENKLVPENWGRHEKALDAGATFSWSPGFDAGSSDHLRDSEDSPILVIYPDRHMTYDYIRWGRYFFHRVHF